MIFYFYLVFFFHFFYFIFSLPISFGLCFLISPFRFFFDVLSQDFIKCSRKSFAYIHVYIYINHMYI